MSAALQSRLGTLALTGVGVVVAIGAHGIGLGSLAAPGPGLWPFAIGLFMTVVGACLLVQGDDGTVEPLEAAGVGVVAAAAASIVGYALLFERIGFEIPTVLLLLVWTRLIGREPWRTSIAVSLVTTVAVYLLFIVGLRVSLPHLF